MRQETQRRVANLLLTSTITLVSWGLIWKFGAQFLDTQATHDWLAKQDWVSFLHPSVRSFVVLHAWQPLASLGLALFSRRYLKRPTEMVQTLLFGKAPATITVRWGEPQLGLRNPEFVLILGTNVSHPDILVGYHGQGTARIKQVRVRPKLFRQLKTSKAPTLMIFKGIEINPDRGDEDDGQPRWNPSAPGEWTVDDLASLQDAQEVALPSFGFAPPKADDDDHKAIESLVGDARLLFEAQVEVRTESSQFRTILTAPFRILKPLDDGYDGGLWTLLDGLGLEESEAESYGRSIQAARAEDFATRARIAQGLNEASLLQDLERLDQRIRSEPDNPERLCERATALIAAGRMDEAKQSVMRARELRPEDVQVAECTATVLLECGQAQEAFEILRPILDRHIERASLQVLGGRVLSVLEENQLAVSVLQRAIVTDPTNSDAHLRMGLALYSLERFREAHESFDRAIELDESEPTAYVGKALTSLEDGTDEDALQALEHALRHGASDRSMFEPFQEFLGEDSRQKLLALLSVYLPDFELGELIITKFEITTDHPPEVPRPVATE